MGWCRLCDPADFEDADFLAAVRDVLPERDPTAHIERKAWELAMVARFLGAVGALHDGTRALGVGAGDERIVFWLANRVGHVLATDIYGDGDFGDREATTSMLTDPAAHAPFPYREDHLEVRWMDARSLDVPDASVDVVFSISSIEHFGAPAEVMRAAREIGRVLRPGGHAAIVTECFVRRHPLNAAPLDAAVRALTFGTRRRTATLRRRGIVDQVFTPRELRRRIVAASGLELVDDLDTTLNPAAWANLTVQHDDGTLVPRTGAHWPHVLLQVDRSVFTSVFLGLRKPG